MVLGAGLEPARISPHAPQACVSANFTTRAAVETRDSISNLRAARKGVNAPSTANALKNEPSPSGPLDRFLMRWKCLSAQQPASSSQSGRSWRVGRITKCSGNIHRTRPIICLCVGIEPALRRPCPSRSRSPRSRSQPSARRAAALPLPLASFASFSISAAHFADISSTKASTSAMNLRYASVALL